MAEFEPAVEVVLDHEGGVGKLDGDTGGTTAFGWSAPMCQKLGIASPKTADEAKALYLKFFWKPLYNKILSQNVATKILDDCVNQGDPEAVKNLQTALCAVGSIVEVDGVFGSATLTALNLVPEVILLPEMRKQQWQDYQKWISQNPVRQKLAKGMAKRAAWPDPDGTIQQALLDGTYDLKGA